MRISVIGTGYVGLVTGACLAEIGHEVVCTDSDVSKIKMLESGGLPIYEPGLDKVIAKARKEGRLRFCAN
ncbi:MAG: UDP-glucose 6-dehydrogenase, partial [Bryobacteraceae bacterium]